MHEIERQKMEEDNRAFEEFMAAQENAEIAKRVEELNEGNEPCAYGQYCNGNGLVVEAGTDCGFCEEIESGIAIAESRDY